jgi:putative transposase
MCVKNDKVTKHYSEYFKLKILAEFSTKKYVKNQLIKGRTIYPLAINVWIKKCAPNDLINTKVIIVTKNEITRVKALQKKAQKNALNLSKQDYIYF